MFIVAWGNAPGKTAQDSWLAEGHIQRLQVRLSLEAAFFVDEIGFQPTALFAFPFPGALPQATLS